jgi:ABC-type multidrug transport system ATPase subunit/ABC-type transport system involved in multi-copper enzyme maturation permease subunit
MIELRNVTKRYGRRVALADVSLTLPPGEVTLLLGANGAGKSTLLRCLLGIADYEGSILVDGLDPLQDGCSVRSAIGYMPQSGGLHVDLTVRETMAFYARIRQSSIDRGTTLLTEAGLGPHLDTLVGELSGGMRQRLGFALALLADPRILVLDEPSSSLDAASRRWLAERLRAAASEGRTVIVSTHAGQELLDAGGRTITLEDGRVVEVGLQHECIDSRGQDSIAPARRAKDSRGWRRRTARVLPIAAKEVRDGLTNRWLIAYALLLGGLGLAATATGLDSASGLAIQAYGRTTATLMNLCLLLSPLVAVVMGAALIAGEQDRGTLEHLLAQPLTRAELLIGKHLGLLAALTAATVAGFVPAGVGIAVAAGPAVLGHYLLFPAIAALAGAAMAAVGALISVASRSSVHAQGMAMLTWFTFVLLYDLVLMGSLAVSGMPAQWLAAALIGNPVDAARVLGVLALEPDLYLLGPAGSFLTSRLSAAGTASVLMATLVLWALAPLCAAAMKFSIRRRLSSYVESKIRFVTVGRDAGRGDRVHVPGGVAGVKG